MSRRTPVVVTTQILSLRRAEHATDDETAAVREHPAHKPTLIARDTMTAIPTIMRARRTLRMSIPFYEQNSTCAQHA